ncbi:MAG: Rieske (2Fe-2S) protein [Gammaproteobacteria bacterium]|jgi:nitrite reductase/ring-hydroxylating ferredoxin subunit|nr:Rieske (2Fe-2S) protein [Gammaproteobacteria bacterium]
MSNKQIQISLPEELEEGRLVAVDADGVSVLLSRINGVVHAVVNRCPHLGMKMSRGKICDGIVTCPWHGSRFDFCSGDNVDWVNSFAGIPMPGWTHKMIAMGKSPEGLQSLAVQEQSGSIVIHLPD